MEAVAVEAGKTTSALDGDFEVGESSSLRSSVSSVEASAPGSVVGVGTVGELGEGCGGLGLAVRGGAKMDVTSGVGGEGEGGEAGQPSELCGLTRANLSSNCFGGEGIEPPLAASLARSVI